LAIPCFLFGLGALRECRKYGMQGKSMALTGMTLSVFSSICLGVLIYMAYPMVKQALEMRKGLDLDKLKDLQKGFDPEKGLDLDKLKELQKRLSIRGKNNFLIRFGRSPKSSVAETNAIPKALPRCSSDSGQIGKLFFPRSLSKINDAPGKDAGTVAVFP